MNTENRSYPLMAENEQDKAQAVNDLASAIDGDMQNLIDGETALAKVTTTGDVEIENATAGLILKDRVTGSTYRLKIESGVLGVEFIA